MPTPHEPRRLFVGLLDDAAMFPPGNATASAAIAEHRRHRASWYADLVGPLLVRADRWGELRQAHEEAGSPGLRVVVIASTRRPDPVPSGIEVAGYEAVVVDQPLALPPDGSALAAEIDPAAVFGDSRDRQRRDRTLAEIVALRATGAKVIAKIRTGGESPADFPPEEELAAAIVAAAARQVPLKFTAGLHHAIRRTDPTTGIDQHGFLNLLAASKRASEGAGTAELAALLAQRDGAALVGLVRAWSDVEAAAARSAFASFGCCGVEDPVADLVALGLVAVGWPRPVERMVR